MASSSTPNEKLTNLLSELRDTLETVSERLAAPPLATSRNEDTTSASNGDASDEEIQQLKLNVTRLQGELGTSAELHDLIFHSPSISFSAVPTAIRYSK